MNIKRITDLSGKLDRARIDLDVMKKEAALLNLNGHQEIIRVGIGNKSSQTFSLAEIDHRHSYAAVAIRGTEMVMLGVKKLYAARIDSMKEHIADIEALIKQETGA